MKLKSKTRFIAFSLALAVTLPTSKANAGTGDNGGWWQTWSGLYVSTVWEIGNGNVNVRFLNSNGNEHLGWVYQGNPVCQASSWLTLSANHPQHEKMLKAVMAAGLSQQRVFVVMQPVGGTCYLKQIRVEFAAPN